MRFSYLRVPTALMLAASSFAASPNIPKALASAVSQSKSLDIKSTTVHIDAIQPKTLDGYRKQGDTPTALNQTFQNLSTMFLKRSNSISSSTLPLVSSQELKPTSTILNHGLTLLSATTADPTFAATQEHIVEPESNRPNTQMLVAGNISLGRGIYIRFNRSETYTVAHRSNGILILTVMCAAIPNPVAAAACAAALPILHERIKQTATQAYEDEKCLMLVTTYNGIPYRWEPYSGRSCR